MSVRFSQLLVAIVLALLASGLYRTFNAYWENAAASQLHTHGVSIAEHATQRLGQHIAALETLARLTSIEGYNARTFAARARALMRKDPAVLAVDFFNAEDVHQAHIAASAAAQFGNPLQSNPHPTRATLDAIEQAMFDAELSRATSISDVPVEPGSRAQPVSSAEFFAAAQAMRRNQDIGTLVAYLDPRRLILNDLAIQLQAGPFALDDSRGHSITKVTEATVARGNGAQTFPIQFADRILRLTVPAPESHQANPWWFFIAWLALVIAICLPIEAVGSINRRVQILNEQLEVRVAARTHELEATLRESRRLATVVESVHEGVMWIDSAGTIAYVNAALCEELGLAAKDLLGRLVAEMPGLGLPQSQLESLRKAVSKLGFVYSETERTRRDGSSYVAGVTFARYSDADAGGGGLIAVSRDITDRRKLVDQLIAAKSQLEHQIHARADFIGTASHELRTPVTTLRTLATLLSEKFASRYRVSGDDLHLLELLEHETRRLAHLVDDLLEIAKIDAPETTLTRNVLDLRELVRNEMAATRLLVKQSGPSIALELADAPALVFGDENALRSILNNLVDNARKFTPAHGHITIAVRKKADGVILSVADSGIGIAQSDLPHIFERFYRVRQAASDTLGSGLGLAIVARLVDLMHGTISVASEIGRGTTITIEYPAASAAAEAMLQQASGVS